MIRPRAGGARSKAVPKTARSKKAGGRGATGGARTVGTRTRRSRSPAPSLPSLGVADWIKYGLAVIGLLGGVLAAVQSYGAMTAKVEAMAKEQERQGRVLQSVYDHVAWGQGGTAGPAPPLPGK